MSESSLKSTPVFSLKQRGQIYSLLSQWFLLEPQGVVLLGHVNMLKLIGLADFHINHIQDISQIDMIENLYFNIANHLA